MNCSRSGIFRGMDMTLLIFIFIFQSLVLNYIIIWHHSSSFISFMWFLGDFFCLGLFSFSVFLAHRFHQKRKEDQRRNESRASFAIAGGSRSPSPQGNPGPEDGLTVGFNQTQTMLPCTYMTWIFYSVLLTLKICVLFKTNIAQKVHSDELLGPQMLKFAIGLSTLIFSLLVESHHNAMNNPLLNSYLNAAAFGVAVEILDSVSILSLLIPSESHLIYTYTMENFVIALASINIILPAVTIYKLSASNFGRLYHVPLETIYKFLHLVLVNLPFFCLRMYLWQMYSTDTSIFLIKNLYAMIAFVRGIYPDIKLLRMFLQPAVQIQNGPMSPDNVGKSQNQRPPIPPPPPESGLTSSSDESVSVYYQNKQFDAASSSFTESSYPREQQKQTKRASALVIDDSTSAGNNLL